MPADPRRAQFVASPDPPAALMDAAAAAASDNPMMTRAYAGALRAAGERVVLLALEAPDGVRAACYARMRRGRLTRTVQVDAWPSDRAGADFVQGFLAFCARARVDIAELDTFGVAGGRLPGLPGVRRARCEHRWDLDGGVSLRAFSANHRRAVNRARGAGVTVRVAEDPAALEAHARLARASLDRRARRGERVPVATPDPLWRPLLAQGSARLHQAMAGGEVVSSILVLRAPHAAYYQSAGTSAQGMELGASHLLILETAALLASEGVTLFNLGGAEESSAGLYRFKSGFGTRPIALEAGRFDVTGGARRLVRRAIGTLARSVRGRGAP